VNTVEGGSDQHDTADAQLSARSSMFRASTKSASRAERAASAFGGPPSKFVNELLLVNVFVLLAAVVVVLGLVPLNDVVGVVPAVLVVLDLELLSDITSNVTYWVPVTSLNVL